MRWACGISQERGLRDAVDHVGRTIDEELRGEAPHLLIAFVSPHHARHYESLPALLLERYPGATLLGCSGLGIIGGGHEVEGSPALSLTAAALPNVTVTPFHVDEPGTPQGVGSADAFIVLPDPFTCDAAELLRKLDADFPRSPKVGGMASGGRAPGQNVLFIGRATHRAGAVGVALHGDVAIDTLVAQGCRPIGEPWIVTSCEGNVIRKLGDKTPVEVLRALHESLDERDQQLFMNNLFVGMEMRGESVRYKEGDLLVRDILGTDPKGGALVVSSRIEQWQVLRFLLHDARTAAEDLERHLDGYVRHAGKVTPSGALLFSCLGRGVGLYGSPDHDSSLFRAHVGRVPLGGFFCNGEIGPVGGTTFLHGYTSAFALFRPKGDLSTASMPPPSPPPSPRVGTRAKKSSRP
jgi:small ligand-binding sensory domain FIST